MSFFFFKQKTAYEMRISDWSSDVCSSDLVRKADGDLGPFAIFLIPAARNAQYAGHCHVAGSVEFNPAMAGGRMEDNAIGIDLTRLRQAPGCGKPLAHLPATKRSKLAAMLGVLLDMSLKGRFIRDRSEEHPSELQSIMRHLYAVF